MSFIYTRAYPGDYMPPLPWMKSARNAEGGMARCRQFWSTHAYRVHEHAVREHTLSDQVPSWARPKTQRELDEETVSA